MGVVLLGLGLCLRVLGFFYGPWYLTSPHMSSPYTDAQRLWEGFRYYEIGLSPQFPGSPVHHHPALLSVLYLLKEWPGALQTLWVCLELGIAVMLQRMCVGPM